VLANIQEEVAEKIIPTIERNLLLLSDLRGLLRAKHLQFGGSTNASQMYFGLNESIIQKLIDFMSYYYHQA
jgi:hypothetical protein